MDLEEFKKLAALFVQLCRGFNAETHQTPVNLLFGTINRGKRFTPEAFHIAIAEFHPDAAGLVGLENFNFLIYCRLIRPAVRQATEATISPLNEPSRRKRVLPAKFRRQRH